jgi:RNA recognition motif-containing protein
MSYTNTPNQQIDLAKASDSHSGYSNNPLALFVGDLSFFCAEKDLRDLFSNYGTVQRIEIKRGKATGDSLMHGFVEMDSPASVERALNALHGTKFMGRNLR